MSEDVAVETRTSTTGTNMPDSIKHSTLGGHNISIEKQPEMSDEEYKELLDQINTAGVETIERVHQILRQEPTGEGIFDICVLENGDLCTDKEFEERVFQEVHNFLFNYDGDPFRRYDSGEIKMVVNEDEWELDYDATLHLHPETTPCGMFSLLVVF